MPNRFTRDTSRKEVEKELEVVDSDDSNVVNSTSNRCSTSFNYLRGVRGSISGSGNIYCHYPPEKIFKLGERGSGLRSRGEIQDFHQLKQEYLSNGMLFEDSTFPRPKVIYTDNDETRSIENVEWKRPKDISYHAKFFVDGGSRFDTAQKGFGDCWLLAGISSLAMHPVIFDQVVPKDQSFEDEEYAGIFHFRLWQYGRWIDVVIDDFLPTQGGRLVSSQSSTRNEFWSSLLVKAYAKLYGSWRVISGGLISEAVEDFSGGITRLYYRDTVSPEFFNMLLKDYQRNAFMGCSWLKKGEKEGLIKGHAYTITKVCKFDTFRLLRLRNPWGDRHEWTGAWSDNSPEWKSIPESKKEQLGLNFDDDGEFWMSIRDLQSFYKRIDVCYLNPVSSMDTDVNRKWQIYAFESEWIRGLTAGGSEASLGTFSQNPQYRITVDSPDEETDICTVIVALMQKHRRAKGEENPGIKVAIYRLDENGCTPKPLDTDYFAENSSIGVDSSWVSDSPREFTRCIELSPGSYCIIPYIINPHEEGQFLLRVFCDGRASMEEYDEEIGYGEPGTMMKDHRFFDEDYEADILSAKFKDISQNKLEITWKQLKAMLMSDLNEGGNNGYAWREERQQILVQTAGKDAHITVLAKKYPYFNVTLCRNIVILMDELDSGKLGFEEYKALRLKIRNWKEVFNSYDGDDFGYLRTSELKRALNCAGYRVNKQVLKALLHRNQKDDGKITFQEFVMCALELMAIIDELENEKESTRAIESRIFNANVSGN